MGLQALQRLMFLQRDRQRRRRQQISKSAKWFSFSLNCHLGVLFL
jgi:hypothetical protein